MSVSTEPNSTETITSRLSVLSCEVPVDGQDDHSLSSSSLNTCTIQRHAASQPLTGGRAVTRTYSPNANYLPLACLAFLLNPIMGIPAISCAYISKSHKRRGGVAQASKYGALALWTSVVAIAVFIVVTVFVFVYIFVITPNIIRSISGFSLDHDVISHEEEMTTMPST